MLQIYLGDVWGARRVFSIDAISESAAQSANLRSAVLEGGVVAIGLSEELAYALRP
jgi:hypothetical protein